MVAAIIDEILLCFELLEHDVGDFEVGELAAEEDAGFRSEQHASLGRFFGRRAVRAAHKIGVQWNCLRAGVEEELEWIVPGLAMDIDSAGKFGCPRILEPPVVSLPAI